jgi:large subunit ribosomal protein L24
MAARIRKDDIVEVIAGDSKGARGKVLKVLVDEQRVLVEGVNMVVRHMRRNRQGTGGGRVRKEAPIHVSNVMPVNPKTNRATRVRFATTLEGGKVTSKQRVATDGTVLSEVKRAAAARGQQAGR